MGHLSYQDYLQLDKILMAQKPFGANKGQAANDEMLFIITHQTYELWFKQVLFELDSVIKIYRGPYVNENELQNILNRMQRIISIQKLLLDQFNVLESMSPIDFLEFRDSLRPASGFQSLQFRHLEIKLGYKITGRDPMDLKFFQQALSEKDYQSLLSLEKEDNLLDLIEKWLERIPFLLDDEFNFWEHYEKAVSQMIEREKQTLKDNSIFDDEEREKQIKELDQSLVHFRGLTDESLHNELIKNGNRYISQKATMAALFIHLYREMPILQLPHRILMSLIDIGEFFSIWKYRHVLLAHRMLGNKVGTGGSSGHSYLLNSALKGKVFQDFYNITTFFLPRKDLPDLPQKLRDKLNFHFEVK